MMSTKKKTIFPKKMRAWRTRTVKIFAPAQRIMIWRKSLRPNTPHRSFRRTYRRDYVRPLGLPGYIGFTVYVWNTLRQHIAVFVSLVAVYALASGLLVGVASQSMYTQLSELIRSTGGEVFSGNIGKIGEASALLLAGVSGSINPDINEVQQMVSGLLVLLAWLTAVWLLRAFLAGQKPGLKDGLYNSGAPLIPTFLLSVFLLAQLIPAAIAAIGVSAAMPTGLINEGVEAMLFWVVVIMLVVLSLYWVTSTLIALIIVTLPGMYPLKALKAAHELVVGRRLNIVLRIVWLGAATAIVWGVVMIPIIILDAWLKGVWQAIELVPIVPIALLVASSASVVWAASYIYLLYRKLVDDDTASA